MVQSPALTYIQSKGWQYKPSGDDKIELERCGFCGKGGYGHFYLVISDGNRDGLFCCHKCGATGNLTSLREKNGDKIPGVTPISQSYEKMEALPDIEAAHQALLENEDALDYLQNTRGFSREIIIQQKIGYTPKRHFRECGDVPAIIYPYLVQGNTVFAHFRTLPPSPKAFSSPKGWDAPLYNSEVIREGVKDFVMVEGEANVIAALDHGITDIVGVPGANFKKAMWIEEIDQLGIERIYICYDKDKAGQRAAQTLASRIGIEKCYKIVLPDFSVPTNEGVKVGKDLNEWFLFGNGTKEAFEQLKQEAKLFDVTGVVNTTNALDELEEMLDGRDSLKPKYDTPWMPLNKLVGFEDGDVIDICAPEKVGKFLQKDCRVKTITGWKKIGDLIIGEEVASIDGKPSFVTGIFPQGKMPLFEVKFSDGRATLAGAEHLWKVRCNNEWERWPERIYTTQAIAGEYCYPGSRRISKLYVPLVSGDFGDEMALLPINPWFMGVLIGDGSISNGTPRITTIDKEIVHRVDNLGYKTKQIDDKNYSLGFNGLIDDLKNLGLYGHTAKNKFIPKIYLEADKQVRWELLRGLMDTDGTAGNKYGTMSYCTISKQLAKDVQYLVRSLGGISRISKPQRKQFRYKGELRTGQPAYIVSVLLPEREKAFTLKRKLDRVKPRKHQPRLTFESITPIGEDEAVCISVSHPSKLYITDDFIVTHNTTFGMNVMEYEVDTQNEDGVIICLEMSTIRLVRKWVSHVTGTNDSIPKSLEEAKGRLICMKDAVKTARNRASERKGTLYFCYPQIKDVDDAYKLIIDCIRRYGVKWIMFDNLQLLCDKTLKNQGHRTIHLSTISKNLASIAKDYGVKIIRVLQPHRIRDGEIITTNDVDGSSQIAKDCDCMLTLHRNPIGEMTQSQFEAIGFAEQEQAFDSKMLVSVGLSRYSSGGYVTLFFDGATSSVWEYDKAQKAMLEALKPKVGYVVPTEVLLKPQIQEPINEIQP
jgi:replicative DNA helicase